VILSRPSTQGYIGTYDSPLSLTTFEVTSVID